MVGTPSANPMSNRSDAVPLHERVYMYVCKDDKQFVAAVPTIVIGLSKSVNGQRSRK